MKDFLFSLPKRIRLTVIKFWSIFSSWNGAFYKLSNKLYAKKSWPLPIQTKLSQPFLKMEFSKFFLQNFWSHLCGFGKKESLIILLLHAANNQKLQKYWRLLTKKYCLRHCHFSSFIDYIKTLILQLDFYFWRQKPNHIFVKFKNLNFYLFKTDRPQIIFTNHSA